MKRLPDDEQKAYKAHVEQEQLKQKDLQIQTYEAQQSFNAQLGELRQDEIEVLRNAPADIFDDKPQTMLAIQQSGIGAKALVSLMQQPDKLEIFEQLGDAAGLEFMKAIARNINVVAPAPMNNVPNIAPQPETIPKPAPQPPTRS